VNGAIKHLVLALGFSCLLSGCSEPGAESVSGAAAPAVPAVEQSTDAGASLEGMIAYLADAPLFRDCSTGRVFPVAMAGPYVEVERAYFDSGIKSGSELKVAVHGRYLERPEMEGNSNEIMLVIDSFDGLPDSNDCMPMSNPGTNPETKPAANPLAVAELKNTFWKLVELNGDAVPVRAGEQEVHLVLSGEETRVNGFAGCNRFFGQYELDGAKLSFSALGSTMMACPEGMDTELAFLRALGENDRMELDGLSLLLYSTDRLVARLEAVYLP
jgi:heat shock protein HslJ